MLLPQRYPGRPMLPARYDSLLRFYSLDLWRLGKTLEFIGYCVDRDEPEEGSDHHDILYQDVRTGLLHYCYGYEEEMGDWDAHVEVSCEDWTSGWTLEEIRAGLHNRYGPDVGFPDFLVPPPPEVEEMHRETGYDS